jgi:hypothetical protein
MSCKTPFLVVISNGMGSMDTFVHNKALPPLPRALSLIIFSNLFPLGGGDKFRNFKVARVRE